MINEERLLSLLGKKIRVLRKERGLTQAGLAEKMDIDEFALRRLELKERNDLKLTTLVKLCNALDVSIDELLDVDGLDKKV